ncbi:MAG: nuclear transport factor 2 family protein [Verrucomicrobia bacterium]|nr:nuclear transport factor 2 family protein [Verrucomicrobiota bacterium]
MSALAHRWSHWAAIIGALLLAGCAATTATSGVSTGDRQEISTRIAAIRDAILAKSAAGIVRDSTPDYAFTGADGVTFDRDGFVRRTEGLFARVLAIESLDTHVDSIAAQADGSAAVEITQTMVRREKAADTGAITRLWLCYREQHTWVRVTGQWRVRRVQFIGTPERKVLPESAAP